MTSGFSRPYPPMGHPDDPDNDPSMIYAFHIWVEGNYGGPIHKSKTRYGGNFYLWDITNMALKLDPDFVKSHPASMNYDVSAPDTAILAPGTCSDFYWEGRGFNLRGVLNIPGGDDSLIISYGYDYDPNSFRAKQKSFEDHPIWKYARDPVNNPPPPYGVADLKTTMAVDTGCKELAPLLNDKDFIGYGTRLMSDDEHCRTIYRFYTKKIPYSMDPKKFNPKIPKEVHPSVNNPERSFVADLWMRGETSPISFPYPGGRQFSMMKIVHGEIFFSPNTYPSGSTPSAMVLPETASDWMIRTPPVEGQTDSIDIQVCSVWKTAAGYPMWMWYRGGCKDRTEFDKFTKDPVGLEQVPFGVGGFDAVIRLLTEDPALEWVTHTRFHAHGTRILQATGELRTTYKLYKENKPVESLETLDLWGRFM